MSLAKNNLEGSRGFSPFITMVKASVQVRFDDGFTRSPLHGFTDRFEDRSGVFVGLNHRVVEGNYRPGAGFLDSDVTCLSSQARHQEMLA